MSNQPTLTIPVIALRGLVIFPDMMIQFDVGRKKSVLALAAAMEKEQLVLLVSQTDLEDGEPAKDQLYRMGVVAKIKQVLRHSEEGVRLFAEGLYRAQIESVVKETPFLLAEVSQPEIPAYKVTTTTKALIRRTRALFEDAGERSFRKPDLADLEIEIAVDRAHLADHLVRGDLRFEFLRDRDRALAQDLREAEAGKRIVPHRRIGRDGEQIADLVRRDAFDGNAFGNVTFVILEYSSLFS